MHYNCHFFLITCVMQSSSVGIINADRPPSATEPQNEEHSGAVTSSDVVMEANPAYQPLETAAAHLEIRTMESEYYI